MAADNPESNAGDQGSVPVDDSAWIVRGAMPGYDAGLPLTPKDLQKPEVIKEQIDTLRNTGTIVAAFLPAVDIVGIAAGAGKMAQVVGDSRIVSAAVKAAQAAGRAIGIGGESAQALTEEASMLNQMSKLEGPHEITAYVQSLLRTKGPGALENIRSCLNTAGEQIQPAAQKIWQHTLKGLSVGENNEVGVALNNLQSKPEITSFVEDLANRGELHNYFNDIRAYVSRGYVRPGTEADWREALTTVAQQHTNVTPLHPQ
jgi:hypothetical protein